MRLYVIGDIHGQLGLLREVHDRIMTEGGRDAVIAHVGDLVDRGPDSRGVVQHLIDGQDAGRRWIVVRGNHDRLMSRFLARPDWIDPGVGGGRHWLDHANLGAAETLASYGVDAARPRAEVWAEARRAVPGRHAKWLATLPLWFLHPEALVVHAGVRPCIDLQDQTEQDLVWIRDGFLDSDADHGPLVVHGHTAIATAAHHGNRINIDGGAAYGRPLCAIALECGRAHLLTQAGRVPLEPERR